MEGIKTAAQVPDQSSGFSVALAEKVLSLATNLGLKEHWKELGFGNVTRRSSAYRAEQRIQAVLAGLACGLRGVAPGNLLVRPNSAMQQRLGGSFPDQGTIHRWLDQITAEQATKIRSHLHQVVRQHGRFRQELWSGRKLVVDMDGQGLAARGPRFEHASGGYFAGKIDKGYQRYVCYVGKTGDVLDELLVSGNRTAMSVLPEMVAGLNEVFAPEERSRVVLRGDAHFGTVAGLITMKEAGYHYVCPLLSHWAKKKLKQHVSTRRGRWFAFTDRKGNVRRVQCWQVGRWQLRDRNRKRLVRPYATVYCSQPPKGKEAWTVLLSDQKPPAAQRLWHEYHERGGTIEEYNDQSERAYHLEIMRTGNFAGLNALQALVGLCWNLTRWSTEELTLPPVQAPQADSASWVPASAMDMSQLIQRAQHSGLRLYRPTPTGRLEVENTAATPESETWLHLLQQPIQQRLRLAG